MHKYELIFILRPDTPEEEIDRIVGQMQGYVTGAGGSVDKVDKMGRRRLAYRVHRQREGFYVRLAFASGPGAVGEIERRLRVTDAVIKFLTVKVDEDEKRGAKLAAIRAKKESRRKKPAAQGAAQQGAAEAHPA